MNTEQFEQQLHVEASAVHFLNDTVADYLLNHGHAAKIGEIATQAGKHIGAGAKLIRQTLTDNPLFCGEERRWNLSVRTLFHRPVEGALQQILRIFGRPMTIAAFSNEMAVLNARAPEYFQEMLPRFFANRPQTYFQTPDGRWGLVEWLLDITSSEEEEALERNFFGQSAAAKALLEQLQQTVGTPAMGYSEGALSILEAVDYPLSHKIISYIVWRTLGDDFNPLECYLTLLNEPRLHLLSGNEWMATQQISGIDRQPAGEGIHSRCRQSRGATIPTVCFAC